MAGSAKLSIVLLGDAASAKRAFAETGAAAEASGGKLQSIGSKLGSTFKDTFKTFVPLAAGFAAADFAKGAIDGAENLRKAQDGLALAIDHTGGSSKKLMGPLSDVAKSAAQFGITQVQATQGLQKATLIAGGATAGMRAYQEALAISKATGNDFNATLLATSKGQQGITTSLQRYGIAIAKGTSGQMQFNDVMKTFGGQASANTSASDKLRASFSNLQTNIGTLLLPAFDKIVEGINRVVVWFQSPGVSSALHQFGDQIGQVMHGVANVITTTLDIIRGIWARWGKQIKEVVKLYFSGIELYWKSWWDVVSGVFKVAADILQGHWGKAWHDFKGIFVGIFDNIKGYVHTWVSAISGVLGALGNSLVGTFKGIGNAIAAVFKAPINAIIAAIDAIELPSGIHIKTWHGIPDGFSINWAHPFHIPALAEGGIVTGPTLAMIGERGPEAVVPLNRSGVMGGPTINIGPVYGHVDAGFAQAVAEEVAVQLKGGRVPRFQQAIKAL